MRQRWQGDPRRRLLLECYLAAAADAERWREQLQHSAGQRGLVAQCHDDLLTDTPDRAAVLVAHRLAMARPGLHAWRASWDVQAMSAPAEYLALAASRLLTHRDELLLLSARFDPEDAGGSIGALVDAQTCARLAVAGCDADVELRGRRQLAALEAAGDLLHGGVAEPSCLAPAGQQLFLILGLRQHATAAD